MDLASLLFGLWAGRNSQQKPQAVLSVQGCGWPGQWGGATVLQALWPLEGGSALVSDPTQLGAL